MKYRDLRAKLDKTIEQLETADSSDIDKIVALHAEALNLIDQLEKQLGTAIKLASKSK